MNRSKKNVRTRNEVIHLVWVRWCGEAGGESRACSCREKNSIFHSLQKFSIFHTVLTKWVSVRSVLHLDACARATQLTSHRMCIIAICMYSTDSVAAYFSIWLMVEFLEGFSTSHFGQTSKWTFVFVCGTRHKRNKRTSHTHTQTHIHPKLNKFYSTYSHSLVRTCHYALEYFTILFCSGITLPPFICDEFQIQGFRSSSARPICHFVQKIERKFISIVYTRI